MERDGNLMYPQQREGVRGGPSAWLRVKTALLTQAVAVDEVAAAVAGFRERRDGGVGQGRVVPTETDLSVEGWEGEELRPQPAERVDLGGADHVPCGGTACGIASGPGQPFLPGTVCLSAGRPRVYVW
ncbi:unnamed protein product [Ectocarpus fasciculatus]